MIKIIGDSLLQRYCFVVGVYFSFCSLFSVQEVFLDITDMRDRPIEQVEVGALFKIKVSLHGDSISNQNVTIPGLEKACVTVNTSSMSMTPAGITYTYSYHVYMDAMGSFTFGPIIIDYRGKTVTSKTKTIEVVAPQAEKPSSKTKQKDPIFVRLYSDKKIAFVGEPVTFYLEFYTKDPLVELAQVISPRLSPTLAAKNYLGPDKGSKIMGGTMYTYYRWKWTVHPKDSGEFVIPSYSVSYLLPERNTISASAFSVFFGMLPMKETVHSNAAVITVKPLPHYKSKVHAIGSFKNFSLELKQLPAKVGQAFIAALHLTGLQEDIDAVTTPPELVALPTELTYYDSEVSTVEIDDTQAMKTFEYVIQPLQPGTLKIPEQKFTFFDTTTSSYVSLTTKPCTVTIESLPEPQEEQSLPAVTTENQVTDTNNPLQPIILDVSSSSYTNWFMPLPLFLFCMFIPLFGLLFFYGIHVLIRLYAQLRLKSAYKNAFALAHHRVYEAEKRSAYDALYSIFMELLSVRLSKDKQLISDDMIKELYAPSASLQDEWAHFWRVSTAYAFVKTHVTEADHGLFKRAHYWISVMEKRI